MRWIMWKKWCVGKTSWQYRCRAAMHMMIVDLHGAFRGKNSREGSCQLAFPSCPHGPHLQARFGGIKSGEHARTKVTLRQGIRHQIGGTSQFKGHTIMTNSYFSLQPCHRMPRRLVTLVVWTEYPIKSLFGLFLDTEYSPPFSSPRSSLTPCWWSYGRIRPSASLLPE